MKHHKWDTPKDKISATCLNCGCVRIAEKIMGRMSWVYWRKGMGGETPHRLDCKTETKWNEYDGGDDGEAWSGGFADNN